jgi:hypothetical protein
VFAIGSDELSVNGPLLVTGFDQDDDRMGPALMTEADIKAWDIQCTRMAA